MNTYRKKPYSIASYTKMRGVIDFSNASQFNMYESGYQFLTVISRPRYIEMLAEEDTEVANALNLFCWILENEFKNLSGIENITADNLEFTDNISTLNTIGKVNQQSGSEVSMTFTERSGAALTGFIDYYLKGIKDPRTQAKTYHGLIKNGKLAGGFENEVFHLLYIVTDNTTLGLEKAYLLACAWPSTAQTDIYNGEKGSIEKKDIDIPWQCFVIDGDEVDRRALRMLAYISEDDAVAKASTVNGVSQNAQNVAAEIKNFSKDQIHVDSNEYNYAGLGLIEKVYENASTANTQKA